MQERGPHLNKAPVSVGASQGKGLEGGPSGKREGWRRPVAWGLRLAAQRRQQAGARAGVPGRLSPCTAGSPLPRAGSRWQSLVLPGAQGGTRRVELS